MAILTAAQIKENEGISGTQHDTMLGNWATRIGSAVKKYLGRDVEPQTYTDLEIDGNGTNMIVVPHPPVRSVTTLKVTTDRAFAATTAVDSTDFVFDDSGTITLLSSANLGVFASNPAIFFKGIRNVQITYAGGFATVPEDITQAAILIASHWFNKRRMAGLQAATIAGFTTSFQSRLWPSEVRALLDPYKIRTMASYL